MDRSGLRTSQLAQTAAMQARKRPGMLLRAFALLGFVTGQVRLRTAVIARQTPSLPAARLAQGR
jgi:hypothetical protein